MFQGITYEGTVPFGPGTLGHHLPVIDDLNIYLECEQDSDYDIVCTTLDTAYGGFPDPQTIFDDMGNEKNPDVLSGNLVFETDVNGNWDIAYWCSGMDMPELIDSDPAEDRNPMIYLSDYPNAGLHVFWESRRDGSWKIYYSHRDILGIGPERKGSLPGSLALSVHPNPGNAEFHIDLELPVSGEVEAAIYDLSGRRVARIHEGWMGRGLHDLTWNAQRFPSAIYLLQVESGKYHQTRKVVLLK
ncbi:MAG TPA: T9SS type A sorting domain-containing protein [bacterium]